MKAKTDELIRKYKNNQVRNKRLITLAIIILGILIVIGFIQFMQGEYSRRHNTKIAESALNSIIKTLDENTAKAHTLTERYHADNNQVLEDVSMLLFTDTYGSLVEMTPEERATTIRKLSAALGGDGRIFLANSDGKVVLAPETDFIGIDLVKSGSFSKEEFELLTRNYTEGSKTYLGTSVSTKTPMGTTLTSYETVTAAPRKDGESAYFYSRPLTEEYTLYYGVYESVLNEQLGALRNITPVLQDTVIGETGFVFAVDAESGNYMYFNDGVADLTGTASEDSGLGKEVLKDQYSGRQTINGVDYWCNSREYSSDLYGDYIVITAVTAADEVFAHDWLTAAITAFVFAVTAFICLFYAAALVTDPDQLADYDEHILTAKQARKELLSGNPDKIDIKNILAFEANGEPVFFKLGIAQRLAPVIAIGLILIFTVSWNAQTMIELNKGVTESNAALRQIHQLFSKSETSSEVIVNRYQDQYLSKMKLLSYMLEEQPELAFEISADEFAKDAVHTYLDEDFNPILGENGLPVKSVAFSSSLQKLAGDNGLDTLFIFDDHGRVIATSTNIWNFTLSKDPESQSYPFRDIISGKSDNFIQEAGEDDLGSNMQYIGSVFPYYTLSGAGPDNGAYVSGRAYKQFATAGSYVYNGVSYTVVPHRGLIQGGISDATVNALIETTTNEYLMKQVTVDSTGFVILFDNTPEHTCIWSPINSNIGKTAAELNINDRAFGGDYKGFAKINSVDYFQNFFFDNGYWIASTIPTADLFAGRTPMAVITLLISALFFILEYLLCTFTLSSEELSLVSIVENRISKSDDHRMVKVTMQNGKIKYIRDANARFFTSPDKWDTMLPSQKVGRLVSLIMGVVVLVLLFCIAFSNQLFGADSIVSYIIHGDWEKGPNYFAFVAFAVMVVCVTSIASIASKIILFIIKNMGTRIETIGRLLLSVIKYGSVLFSIFYGLSLLGISTTGLVTSAGILSIIVGLGAQSLINDILSGIFIVFEGAFRVGDIVTVDDFFGSVIDIGLRTTKIESLTGDIKIYNNSQISGVLNMTKKESTVAFTVNISYEDNLEMVESLIRSECPKLYERHTEFLAQPRYFGPDFGDSAITLTVLGECDEKDRLVLKKQVVRELYILLRDNGIYAPYNKLEIIQPEQRDELGKEGLYDQE